MPTNTGTPPSHHRVDIELQCGWVIRNVDPKKYDWKLGDQCPGYDRAVAAEQVSISR